LQVRTGRGIARLCIEHVLADRELRSAGRRLDYKPKAESADRLEHWDGCIGDGHRRRAVGRDDAEERNDRPHVVGLAVEEPRQGRQIGGCNETVAVRIRPRTARHGTAMDVAGEIAITVRELIAQLIEIGRCDETIAIDVAGK
jgi:hypothetical protein